MNRHSKRWIAALGLWLAGTAVVCAQHPTDLQLGKHADVSQVAPGDRLRFTLTLTNEGTDELTGLVVSDVTPAGTVFFGAAGPRNWLITTPYQGEEGKVVWRSAAPLSPGESAELEILITVRAESGAILTSYGCTVEADGWDAPLTGPTVTVAVVAPTATPVPGWIRRIVSQSPLWPILGGLATLVVVAVALALTLRRRARKGEVYQ